MPQRNKTTTSTGLFKRQLGRNQKYKGSSRIIFPKLNTCVLCSVQTCSLWCDISLTMYGNTDNGMPQVKNGCLSRHEIHRWSKCWFGFKILYFSCWNKITNLNLHRKHIQSIKYIKTLQIFRRRIMSKDLNR